MNIEDGTIGRKGRVIFHVDLDAFYASVEQSDHPEYRNMPVVIGALPGHRGVVSACSYEARGYGLHSAMPISEAYRRCPQAIFLPVRMSRYQEISKQIMDLFSEFTPEVRQMSVDEAFLEMTGTERLLGPPESVARKIKDTIRDRFTLTISIGIAANHFLAKLASEYSKPDGLFRVLPDDAYGFLDLLELKDLWGLGSKTLERLRELNIDTVSKLRSIPLDTLKRFLGHAAGIYLYNACRGIDGGMFSSKTKSHSISSERTFPQDTADMETIKASILEIAHEVFFRLLSETGKVKTIVVKVRYSDFTTHSIRKTYRHYIASGEEVYSSALELFNSKWRRGAPLRLVGVGLSGVESDEEPEQTELFVGEPEKQKALERTVLSLRSKGSSVVKARLLQTHRHTATGHGAGEPPPKS